MDRAFMEQYFEMAYEDLHGILMRENEDFKEAQGVFHSSIRQLFTCLPADPDHPMCLLQEKFTNEFYMAEYLLMKYAYLKGAEDRDRMLK